MLKSIKHKLLAFVGALALTAAILIPSGAAQAGAMADYLENKSIDWLLRGQTFTPPTASWLALGTNACSDSGSPTEPSGNGYARVSYNSSLANWAGTQGAGTTVASTGTNGTTSNNNAITYSVSTGAWATGTPLQSVWFMDASSGGNVLVCISLTSTLSVSGSGFTLSFPAAALTFQIDN